MDFDPLLEPMLGGKKVIVATWMMKYVAKEQKSMVFISLMIQLVGANRVREKRMKWNTPLMLKDKEQVVMWGT